LQILYICLLYITANGSGKSNILRLIEFFLINATGENQKLHWEQGDSIWEPHKRCSAALHFALNQTEIDVFAKWRVSAILSLLSTEENIISLLRDLEDQDCAEISAAFSAVEIYPTDAGDAYGVDACPLFQRLQSLRMPFKRVKAFWEILEKALLTVYVAKPPFDTVVFTANTEARDRTAVVFNHVLCDSRDRIKIAKQAQGASVSEDVRVIIPPVRTLEDEVAALKAILCPSAGDAPHEMRTSAITFRTKCTSAMWAALEEHLRFGVPSASAAPLTPSSSPAADASPSHRHHEFNQFSLVNCAFLTSPAGNPPTISLVDVRSYCGRLIRKTEKFMLNRPESCRMANVKGFTQIIRRVLLNSVCILPQDRMHDASPTYQWISLTDLHHVVVKLLESGDQVDVQAVGRIQMAMKAIAGQEIQSRRYFDSGATVVGMQPTALSRITGAMNDLKGIGGGHKEVRKLHSAVYLGISYLRRLSVLASDGACRSPRTQRRHRYSRFPRLFSSSAAAEVASPLDRHFCVQADRRRPRTAAGGCDDYH
jgi:hypothetical protein